MKCTRKEIYISLLIISFFLISIGYAYLSTTLTIDSNITIKKKNCSAVKNLYKRISCDAVKDNIASDYVTSSTGIDFNKVPSNTNGKGKYIKSETINNNFSIKYYRGEVTDNNVNFAGYCWKIIRTTEKGGTKLLYNGLVNNGTCANTGTDSLLSITTFNTTSNALTDVGYMYGDKIQQKEIDMSTQSTEYVYGNTVKYDAVSGGYILSDDYTSNSWINDRNTLATKYHYTCFDSKNYCTKVFYITDFTNSNIAKYYELSSGATIDTIKEKSFVNTTDSNIKKIIDDWYKNNMTNYTKYLEDSVWCNNRDLYTGSIKNKDEDSTNKLNIFNSWHTNKLDYTKTDIDLTCKNTRDAFTVSVRNGNGVLTYPTALLTSEEIGLVNNFLEEEVFYTMTPYSYDTNSNIDTSSKTEILGNVNANNQLGVRPSIVIKNEINIKSGTGEENSPYILDLN